MGSTRRSTEVGKERSMSSNEQKLAAWVAEKLEQYDNDPAFAEKRNKKHGDRAGYEAHLKQQVQDKLEAHAKKAESAGEEVTEQLQKEFFDQQEKITNAALQLQNVSDEIQKLQVAKRVKPDYRGGGQDGRGG